MQSRIPMTLLTRQPHPPWPPVRSKNSSLMGMPMILPSINSTRMTAPKTMNHAGASIRHFFLPVIALITADPILRSKPCFVIGIPVVLAIFCLIFVIPTALFIEKESPGIFVLTISFSPFLVLSPNLLLHFLFVASKIQLRGRVKRRDQSLTCDTMLCWKVLRRS